MITTSTTRTFTRFALKWSLLMSTSERSPVFRDNWYYTSQMRITINKQIIWRNFLNHPETLWLWRATEGVRRTPSHGPLVSSTLLRKWTLDHSAYSCKRAKTEQFQVCAEVCVGEIPDYGATLPASIARCLRMHDAAANPCLCQIPAGEDVQQRILTMTNPSSHMGHIQ
jgi:hypothetical protein